MPGASTLFGKRRHHRAVHSESRAVVVDGGGSELLEFRQFVRAEKRTAARGDALINVFQQFETLITFLLGGDVAEVEDWHCLLDSGLAVTLLSALLEVMLAFSCRNLPTSPRSFSMSVGFFFNAAFSAVSAARALVAWSRSRRNA